MKKNNILLYIRRCQYKKILYPLLLIAVVLAILIKHPIWNFVSVTHLPADVSLSDAYQTNTVFVSSSPTNLYYTGYDYIRNGKLSGHYYYALTNDKCQLYIIPSQEGKQALEQINQPKIIGSLKEAGPTFDGLIDNIAKEIQWSSEDLLSICEPYVISEVDLLPFRQILLFISLIICLILALIAFLRMLLYLFIPKLTPTYRKLKKYGNRETIIKEVEYELENEVITSTNDMVLTTNYLVEFSEDLSAIVPLSSVLWAYKHGYINRTWQLKRRMKYTFHVVTVKGDNYSFKNKAKKDVELIQDELSRRFPNFFYGYSEEHAEMVRHIIKEAKAEKNI
ncbi:MAG: DUF6709 family protein [Lachnospiraceae bacterium]